MTPTEWSAPRRRRRLIVAFVALVIGACLSLAAQPAWAHGGSTASPQAVTADLGDLQIRAVIGTASVIPGTLLVDVSFTTAVPSDLDLAVRAWPVDNARPGRPDAAMRILAGDPGPYPTQVSVDRAGFWDIELALPEAVGSVSTVSIPITVTAPRGDPAEPWRAISYATAGLLAVAGTTTAVAARRRAPRVSAIATWSTAPATLTALAVAVTLSLAPLATAVAPGGANQASLPHVNVSVVPVGPAPKAATTGVLEFLLTDGSSGLPVDDVTPHHEALLHVAVMGDSPTDFAHVHPARVSPGRYLLQWTPGGPGEHVVAIELTRGLPDRVGDVGNQVVQRTIQVDGGGPVVETPPVAGLGERSLDGLDVDIVATGPLIAGTPIGIRATATVGEEPAELSQWLGMNGHMMVRDRQTDLFAHLHAVGPMAPTPRLAGVRTDSTDPLIDRMIAARGSTDPTNRSRSDGQQGPAFSTVDFAYTFPTPGRYDAWIQFRHGDLIVTVPVSLEVTS